MKMQSINLKNKCMLAPMAGVTDKAFRKLCKHFGAAYATTEMISAKAITYNDTKSIELMDIRDESPKNSIQLFGTEPDVIAKAAKFSLKYEPDAIDLNMGCPAPKVTKSGAGSALLRDPKLCGDIVNAVKDAVLDVPVTVKLRKGWDDETITYLDVAKVCEESGASAITVHGRTREEMYSGKCDLDVIKKVKECVDIPVIGNGDICSYEDACRMMEYTGCDFVMIGRGALGNPWIFQELNLGQRCDISLYERRKVMLWHAKLICEDKGEYIGMKEARKHMAWYIKGLPNAAAFRRECFALSTYDELEQLCAQLVR